MILGTHQGTKTDIAYLVEFIPIGENLNLFTILEESLIHPAGKDLSLTPPSSGRFPINSDLLLSGMFFPPNLQ